MAARDAPIARQKPPCGARVVLELSPGAACVIGRGDYREPKETMNRLEAEVKAQGMTVFAQIDHAAAAADLGLSLRPTELLIFGPKAGTPLMQSVQTMGIDLPLKALVWQDASGHTWRAGGDHCDVRSRGQFLADMLRDRFDSSQLPFRTPLLSRVPFSRAARLYLS